MAAYQNYNFFSGTRKIRGGGEAIVTSAYNDSVILCIGSCHIAFAPGAPVESLDFNRLQEFEWNCFLPAREQAECQRPLLRTAQLRIAMDDEDIIDRKVL